MSFITQPAERISTVPRENMKVSSIDGIPSLAMTRAAKVGQSNNKAPTGLSKRISMRYAFIRDQFAQNHILLLDQCLIHIP
tara:strand:- start:590 stop:832 length:243 start_codon:yes stop_codon:yes gene_type:complete